MPDTEVSVAMKVGRPPFVGGPRSQALAERARAIAAELGEGKPLGIHPSTGGGTDAGFANRSGKAVVLESLGLPGWGYHAKDEYIQIDQIRSIVRRLCSRSSVRSTSRDSSSARFLAASPVNSTRCPSDSSRKIR